MKSTGATAAAVAMVALGFGCASAPPAAAPEADWKSLFDGETLKGWKVAGGAPWIVEDGIIVADIDEARKGGYLLTEDRYGNFELEMQFQLGYPADSGVFLRSTEEIKAYQITLDRRRLSGDIKESQIGAIYFSGLPQPPEQEIPASATVQVDKKTGRKKIRYLQEPPKDHPFREKDWNDLSIRIEGAAPHIVVRLNGRTIIDAHDPMVRHQADGFVALQVHGGTNDDIWTRGQKARFRNIRIRSLK